MTDVKSTRVLGLRVESDGTEEQHSFGKLTETRSEDGELLRMLIEPDLSIDLDDADKFHPDLLLFYKRSQHDLYKWATFQNYFDWCDEAEYGASWWAEKYDEIDLDNDDPPPSKERGMLQHVLEDAEKTIQLVRQGLPIQTANCQDEIWTVINEVSAVCYPRLRRFASKHQSKKALADCDIIVQTSKLRQYLRTSLSGLSEKNLDVDFLPATSGIKIEVRHTKAKSSQMLRANGNWTRKITTSGSRVLDEVEKFHQVRVRLTYVAGRLLLGGRSIPAKEEKA